MPIGRGILEGILKVVRRPGQDMGRCERCSHVRQFTAREGATYLLEGTSVRCGRNVSLERESVITVTHTSRQSSKLS